MSKKRGTAPGVITDVVGKPLEDARAIIEKAGMKTRVTSVDGVGRIGTCDFRTDRVNLSIERGVVKTARIG